MRSLLHQDLYRCSKCERCELGLPSSTPCDLTWTTCPSLLKVRLPIIVMRIVSAMKSELPMERIASTIISSSRYSTMTLVNPILLLTLSTIVTHIRRRYIVLADLRSKHSPSSTSWIALGNPPRVLTRSSWSPRVRHLCSQAPLFRYPSP